MKYVRGLVSLAVVLGLVLSCGDDDSPTGGGQDTTVPTVTALTVTPGMWWAELRHDTTTTVTRTSMNDAVVTETHIEEHRIVNTLVRSDVDGGTTYHYIARLDSIRDEGGSLRMETDTVVLRVVDGKVQAMVDDSIAAAVMNSPWMTLWKLPMSVGDSWTTLSDSIDSTFYGDMGEWDSSLSGTEVKIRFSADINGTGHVVRMVEYLLNDAERDCFEITHDAASNASAAIDSSMNLGIGLPIPVPAGTQVMTMKSTVEVTEYFSTQYTVPLWTREVSASFDSTGLLGLLWETARDTTRSTAQVTRLYDPETQDTLVASEL